MQTTIIPFNMDTVKEIHAGKIDGKIKTRDGYYDVRVLGKGRDIDKLYKILVSVNYGSRTSIETYIMDSTGNECNELIIEVADK